MKKILKKNILKFDLFFIYSLFSILLFNYIFFNEPLYKFKNSWAYSDLAINYSGGFVRRGLIGEILIYLDQISSNHIIFLFIACLASFLHVHINILKYLLNENFHKRIFFLLHPFGISYIFFNIENFFGRKEYLILNLIIFLFKIDKTLTGKKFITFIFTTTLIILVYEPIIFFFPLIIYILFMKRAKFLTILFMVLPLFILNISMFTFFKNSKNFSSLCNAINTLNFNLNLNEKNCWGAARFLNNIDFDFWTFEVKKYLLIENKITSWLIIFSILFVSLLLISQLQKDNFYKYLFFTSGLFAFFFLAIDFGRWFNLIFLTVIIINYEFINATDKFSYEKIYFITIPALSLFINVPIYLNQEIEIFDFTLVNIKTIILNSSSKIIFEFYTIFETFFKI